MSKYLPTATYRLQFNNHFTFRDLRKALSYFQRLGIGSIYASPIFVAVPGSNHGYDIVDSLHINPEIGTIRELKDIQNIIHKSGIGWIQDIVPNHMAFHFLNSQLMDVLEKGRESSYSGYFDIDWDHPEFNGKLMVPILGQSFDQCIQAKEIQLIYIRNKFKLKYYDFLLPVNELSVKKLCSKEIAPDLVCVEMNDDPASLIAFHSLQYYQLTNWQEVDTMLNYRRFFNINGLICLSMEKEDVFEPYHSFIIECIRNQYFQGLRIDHIDGLKRPSAYFEKLRSTVGEDIYIVAEKILQEGELLKKTWPLDGSSGYDFLAQANHLFFNSDSLPVIRNLWKEISDTVEDAETIIYRMKKKVLEAHFQGDLDNLYRIIHENSTLTEFNGLPETLVKQALSEFLACCPVYKLYSDQLPVTDEDAVVVHQIVQKGSFMNEQVSYILNSLERLFINPGAGQKEAATRLFLRIMQYTGPLMAKGVEDTAMYTWAEFISRNEVGDSIRSEGLSIEAFHKAMADRRKMFPASMNATTTHDTKRGEDARARLNAISDNPLEWELFVRSCMAQNASVKTGLNHVPVPDTQEEYFIYQAIAGAFPMNGEADSFFNKRMSDYLIKSLRESKRHTDWNTPNEAYEHAVNAFVLRLLHEDSAFLKLFKDYFNRIKYYGIVNSLSQLVLKCTCPGIPDFYQGSELWDLSLVDPDNRRPVDYFIRSEYLTELQKIRDHHPEKIMDVLIKNLDDGRIKLWMTHCLMLERKKDPEQWVFADYQPLEVKGIHKDHIMVFCRTFKNCWYLVMIPLHIAAVAKPDGRMDWKNTSVVLPDHAPLEWQSIWDGTKCRNSGIFSVSPLMKFNIPLVLKGERTTTGRGAGVLLHVTSLPGKLGAGTLGKEAYDFVDFLHKSGQSYWQILPFSPVGKTRSPYSAPSAFAGNTNFIDVITLKDQFALRNHFPEIHETSNAEFDLVEKVSQIAIQEAFETLRKTDRIDHIRNRFRKFCADNIFWLNDYALFMALKDKNHQQPWNLWPSAFKNRNKNALLNFQKENWEPLEQLRFAQFLFYEQFRTLKDYANKLGIKIIGDIPIYIDYDSADVWSHPGLFRLDAQGKMLTVAGVPPDYFSKTGQRWNMPVYDWNALKQSDYTWWIHRVRKNLEYCDLLRFDHFRAFSAFWEVEAKGNTAVHGKWTKGPGKDLFDALQREFPTMPFIAEDLGEIDEPVYALRDAYKLPGMCVLQFAFDSQMTDSVHVPFNHTPNSVVYTGTHDNNTLRGWYREHRHSRFREKVNRYAGMKVTDKNVSPVFMHMAYTSVARIVIVPMQDILNLDGSSRFNLPSSSHGNWLWKMTSDDINTGTAQNLLDLATITGRK